MIISEISNIDNGLRATIAQAREGYAVSLTDTDADMMLPTVRVFECITDARTYAKERSTAGDRVWVENDFHYKTEEIHNWIKSLSDHEKTRFAINWRLPHSVFNVACAIRGESESLQNVDWYKIHKSRDLGTFSHGGTVYVQGAT